MKAAPSRHLAHWWNDNCEGVDVYIGQDVQRTMTNADPKTGDKNELATKVKLSRDLPNVKGNVWWHGYWVTDNLRGVADSLALKHQSTIAIPPAYGDKTLKPIAVNNLRIEKEGHDNYLVWDAPVGGRIQTETDAVKFVVYQFFPGEDTNIDDSQTIIAMTPYTRILLDDDSLKGCRFVVTSIDRMNRESEPRSVTAR